jgi:hypothetical protein
MNRLYKVLTICSLLIILGTSAIKSVQSSGAAPAGYTGATGNTCNTANCHTGNALNAAGGSVVATGLPTVAGGYTLAKVYSFSLTITHSLSNRKRWGFAIKAINASGTAVGTFTTTNINAGVSSGELKHNNAPTTSAGANTYTFNNLTWTAPATNTLADKTIRFFIAANAADGSGTAGDFIYATSLNVPKAVSMAVNSFTPTSANIGTTVTIKGIGFTGATAVSFGGTNAASYTVTNDSTISAVVGSGSSGIVSVTSPAGTGTLAGFTFCPTTTTQNLSFTGCNSYTYNGVTYTSSTIKRDTIRTSKGCDSIYKNATITVKTITPTVRNLSFSGCNSYEYSGTTYTSSTIKRDTIRTNQGCDSIYRVADITITTPVSPSNSISSSANNICYNTKVTFTSTANNGCTSPTYQWIKNGNIVGNNNVAYEDSLLNNGDSVWCILTSDATCLTTPTAKSNVINMAVNNNISGNIKTIQGKLISNVIVKRKGTIADSILATASYNFNCIPSTNTTVIRPSKNNDIKKNNGVSGIDIILVTNHILNKLKLNNAYKIIAADVNNDKSISNIDAILMKRLLLGIDTTFTGKRLWAFVDSTYKFPDTLNPFPFKDSIIINNLTDNKINQSFVGIKLGDVNFDWTATVARGNTTKSVELDYVIDNEQLIMNNTQLKVPIRVKNFNQLVAMQYTLNFNNSDYEFVGIENNQLGFDFNKKQANENGNIGFLWTDAKAEAKSIANDSEIFTLIFRKKGISNLQLTMDEAIANIEAWDNNYQQHNIVLTQKKQFPIANNDFVIFPNPANDVLNIQFDKADIKQIKILNTMGNTLYTNKNISTIKSTQLPVNNLLSGIYFIEVTTDKNKVIKRFIKN